MATDRTDDPVLLVTLPYNNAAWFYPSKSSKPSELSVPDALVDAADHTGFGSSLSVLTAGDARVFAVGVPNKSEVLLWRTDGGPKAQYIGSAWEAFRALAARSVRAT